MPRSRRDRQRRRARYNFDGQPSLPSRYSFVDLPSRPRYSSRWVASLPTPAPVATVRTARAQQRRKTQTPPLLRDLYKLPYAPCVPLSAAQKQFGSGSGSKRKRGAKAIRRASITMSQLQKRSC